MLHPEDYDAIEKMFRGSDIPADLIAEYEINRLMASAYGHSGPLGMNLVIPLMRALGYGKVAEKLVLNVDWRKCIGSQVVAQYGDQKVLGKVIGLGTNSRLVLDLQGYGEIELPRYCVQLVPVRELDVEKPPELKSDPWAGVLRGTKVVVTTAAGPADGRFIKVAPHGLLVKVKNEELVLRPDLVELAP
jgi:hypothetical protein